MLLKPATRNKFGDIGTTYSGIGRKKYIRNIIEIMFLKPATRNQFGASKPLESSVLVA